MRIVKMKELQQKRPQSHTNLVHVTARNCNKNAPILATRKHPNSGQKSKCWSQLPQSHTNLVHVTARERKRETCDQVHDEGGEPS